MSQVETVALWVGLIAGIAGTVLALVAIWFAFQVNTRASEVSDQTIRSLRKIESEVERLSKDTSGLIKAAWDKMIGGGEMRLDTPQEDADRMASGLSAELRETLATRNDSQLTARLDQAVERLERSLSSQVRRFHRSDHPAAAVDELVRALSELAGTSVSLLDEISHLHLTRDQYVALESDGYLSSSIRQLWDAGLLVPVSTAEDELVYWYPAGAEPVVRAALTFLLDEIPEAVVERVRAELRRVEYRPAFD